MKQSTYFRFFSQINFKKSWTTAFEFVCNSIDYSNNNLYEKTETNDPDYDDGDEESWQIGRT